MPRANCDETQRGLHTGINFFMYHLSVCFSTKIMVACLVPKNVALDSPCEA